VARIDRSEGMVQTSLVCEGEGRKAGRARLVGPSPGASKNGAPGRPHPLPVASRSFVGVARTVPSGGDLHDGFAKVNWHAGSASKQR
jgi:hypothetical protein